MSASMIVVHVAAVWSESTIARPIDWRIRESGCPSPVGAGSARPSLDFGLRGAAGASGL